MSFWENYGEHFIRAGVAILVVVAAWLTYWFVQGDQAILRTAPPGRAIRCRDPLA